MLKDRLTLYSTRDCTLLFKIRTIHWRTINKVGEKIQMKKTLRGRGTVILIGVILSTAVAIAALGIYSRGNVVVGIKSLTVGTGDSTAAKNGRVSVAVEGMSCPTSCPAGIVAVLNRTPGILFAEASFENKEANVEFDPAAVSPEKIVEAINNMGYRAKLK